MRECVPAHCLLLALLGEEVQSLTDRVIFITAVSGVGEEGGEGEGQGSSHSSSLPKLGLAQPEAGPELEREPGLACTPPRTPAPTRWPTSCLPPCLPDQVKGACLNPSLPSACSLLDLSGWAWGGVDQGGPGTTIPSQGS